MTVCIRHGQRADLAYYDDDLEMEYDNQNDPPLTEKGLKQAFETGQYMATTLKERNYSEV